MRDESEMIQPDNAAAEAFLRQWAPLGPWTLSAIDPEGKGRLYGNTFGSDQVREMRKWLEEWNGKRNLYFTVNSVIKPIKGKASREDIKSLDWLHVDIDPRASQGVPTPESVEAEKTRMLGLLTTGLPEGVPKPTCILFSGGGYQGFWKLEEPLVINGEEEKYEDAKCYNLHLERLFDSDNTHNVDRIMRLPGSVNIPTKVKREKGRVPVLAELVYFEKDLTYPINEFGKADPSTGGQESVINPKAQKPKVKVDLSDEIEPVEDLEFLSTEYGVADYIRIVIAHGHDIDNPKKHPSRSEWVFETVCHLVRKEVPHDIIYRILLDDGWSISESILETRNPQKFALRQIERALEKTIDPELAFFNEKYMIIRNAGGKFRIAHEVSDPNNGRVDLVFQTKNDFINGWASKMKEFQSKDGDKYYKPAAPWWLQHPQQRIFDDVVFAPLRETPGRLNLWNGYGVSSKPGDAQPFLSHVFENICNSNQEHYDYVIGWLARMIQKPASPGEVALVLKGEKGTGKGTFAQMIGDLLGRHYMAVSSAKHLTGNFNGHLEGLILLFADEAFFAGSKAEVSTLKSLITEETMTIERKGIDAREASNFIHLIMASNDEHVVPVGEHERRFMVLEVSSKRIQDHEYFNKLKYHMRHEGGLEALLHFLQTYDISNFNVRQVPYTPALKSQLHLSMNEEQKWWWTKLNDGEQLPGSGEWEDYVRCDQIQVDYSDFTNKLNAYGRADATKLGHFLRKMCPGMNRERRSFTVEEQGADGMLYSKKKRLWCYKMPSLEACRQRWDKAVGKEDWPETQLELPEEPTVVESPF